MRIIFEIKYKYLVNKILMSIISMSTEVRSIKVKYNKNTITILFDCSFVGNVEECILDLFDILNKSNGFEGFMEYSNV